MILIENNEIKYDNIENDLILDELICNSEIARDKTILDCILLNKCKLEMILIENNEIKYDNIENDLILDELICNSEIARDKTILDCILLNNDGQTTV